MSHPCKYTDFNGFHKAEKEPPWVINGIKTRL